MLRRIARAVRDDVVEVLRSRLLHRASNYAVGLLFFAVSSVVNTFISNWLEWNVVAEATVAIGIAVGVFLLWWYGRRIVRRYAHLLEPEPSPEEVRLERIEQALLRIEAALTERD